MNNTKELIKKEKSKITEFQLNRMMFTLVCDRENPMKDNPYYISPGGYELANGKRFDFFESVGYINSQNRTEVQFEVFGLDEDYVNQSNEKYENPNITAEDLKLPFREFYIFTGETYEPQIGIQAVKDVSFEVFENGETKEIFATKEQMDSINQDIQTRYQEFLAFQKELELD